MTFMLEDGKCRGVPQPLKPKLEKYEQRCIRQKVIPTKVEKVLSPMYPSRCKVVKLSSNIFLNKLVMNSVCPKKNEQLIEVVTEDDEGNSSDYEDIDEEGGNEPDAVSVSSTDSHKDSIDGKQAKKKKHGQPALMTKVLKKKKLKKTKKAAASQVLMVKPGDRVVVETLSTRSEADVVWQ